MKAGTVVGRGEKSLISDPGSRERERGRKRRKNAKIVDEMSETKKLQTHVL